MTSSRLRHDQPGPVETVVLWVACAAVVAGMTVYAGAGQAMPGPSPTAVLTEQVPTGHAQQTSSHR